MENTGNGKDKGKNSKRKIIAGIAVVLILVAGLLTSLVVAKYYAYQSAPGVSVASAFYFNSNRLEKNTGGVTMEAIELLASDTSDMPVNVNTSKWTNGDCLFDIEVRNYDNNLLYNENGLDVGYEICFYLLGTPKGANYSVKNIATNESYELTTSNKTKTFAGTLQGGSLSRNQYQIIISLKDGSQYDETVKVLAVAYPVSPDYLYNETDQEYRLAGIFQGHLSEAEMSIESANFLVETEDDYKADWKRAVEDLSGLIFNIKTIGDVVTDDSNTVKQDVVVKWNNKYLAISEYDDYYIAAKNAGTLKINGDWRSMTIKMLPYSSVNITFYKTPQFLIDFKNGSMTKTGFEGLADAQIEETD